MTGTFRSNSQGSTHAISLYPEGNTNKPIHLVIEGDTVYVTIQEGMVSLSNAQATLAHAEQKYSGFHLSDDLD